MHAERVSAALTNNQRIRVRYALLAMHKYSASLRVLATLQTLREPARCTHTHTAGSVVLAVPDSV